MNSLPISIFFAARPWRGLAIRAVATCLAMLACATVMAANWTWDNGAYQNATVLSGTYIGTGQWSNNTNWTGSGTTPPSGGPNNVADDLTFNQYLDNPQQVLSGSVSGTAVNVLWIKSVAGSGSTFSVNSITFTGTSPKYFWAIKPTVSSTSNIGTTQIIQLNGGGITMAADSGPTFFGNANQGARGNLNLQLMANQSITNNSASDLTFGTVDNTAFNAQTLVGGNNGTNVRGSQIIGSNAGSGTVAMVATLNASSTGNIVVNGNFTNGSGAGGLQVVVNNSGSGQVVSTGNFALTGGGLVNLPNPSGLRVLGGTLVVGGSYNASTTLSSNNGIEVASGATLRITRTGTMPLGSNVYGGGTLVYDAGAGNVLALGIGGTAANTAATTISSGTLQVGSGAGLGNGNISIASGARLDVNQSPPNPVLTYSGTISGAGQLTKFGSGTFALTGNNSFTGGITAGDGVLSMAQLDVSRLITGSTPGTLAVAGNGTLDVSTANGVGGLAFRLGTASDLVTVGSGNVQVGNGILDFSDFTFTPVTGFDVGSYTLFSATNLFGSLGIGTTGSVGDKLGTLQVIGNTLQLAVTAVPEPSLTAVTSMAAAAGVLLLRRRRR